MFLGQIGVYTINQVLTSVLPVKHRFIRGLGVDRSILTVDGVRAYDTYMNGLLEAVLKAQADVGGSAILLSAALSVKQKQKLLDTYDPHTDPVGNNSAYPLVNWQGANGVQRFDLLAYPEQLPPHFSIQPEPICLAGILPDLTTLERMVAAVNASAQVCPICNLADVAQVCYQRLKGLNNTQVGVDLFRMRSMLNDRREKKNRVISNFGKNGKRNVGQIPIAARVAGQSLGADFDWLIAQYCPADLLLQRLGRLHCHHRKYRPAGFEIPAATILLPDGEGYGRYERIYSNIKVMWRTQQRVEEFDGASLFFLDVYRQWLDSIYDDAGMDGSEWVGNGMDKSESAEHEKRSKTRKVLQRAEEYSLQDNDETILVITRDGEMSLPLLSYVQTSSGRQLLDGQAYEDLSHEQQYEALAPDRANVPFTRKRSLSEVVGKDGLLWLEGKQNLNGRVWQGNSVIITYTGDEGMTRVIPANPKQLRE